MSLKVLIGCEFSGAVRDAFLERGHDAISCDLIPTEKEGPHHQGPLEELLEDDWDMLIAFPPCQYLSRAGARWLYPKGGMCVERYSHLLQARDFFMTLYNADIPSIAIENPTPFKIADLPEPTQVIQPYEYGHPYTKRTLLWLQGLPKLQATNLVDPIAPWVQSNTGGKARAQKYHPGIARDVKERSRTFEGVALAMADQWGI
tara:strand:+ start:66 stop:674 length:609 start_codon:yes stop_codon:yes gene_type:complete